MSFQQTGAVLPILWQSSKPSVSLLPNERLLAVEFVFVPSTDNPLVGYNTLVGRVFDQDGNAIGDAVQLAPDNTFNNGQWSPEIFIPYIVAASTSTAQISWLNTGTLQQVEFDTVHGTVSPVSNSLEGVKRISVVGDGLAVSQYKYDPATNLTTPTAVELDKYRNIISQVALAPGIDWNNVTHVGLGQGSVAVYTSHFPQSIQQQQFLSLDFYIVAGDGTSVKNTVEVASVADAANHPDVILDGVRLFALAGSNLAVLWYERELGRGEGKLFLRTYDSEGHALSNVSQLDSGSPQPLVNMSNAASVVSAGGQYLFVSWVQNGVLCGAYYSLDGTERNVPFEIVKLDLRDGNPREGYQLLSVDKAHLEVLVDNPKFDAASASYTFQETLLSIDLSLQTGTAKADDLHDTPYNDVIRGLAGDDVLTGGRGNDQIFGGDGNDRIFDLSGQNRLDGGNGTDTINFSKLSSIKFALDHSLGASAADAGSTFISMENLVGTNAGDDELSGDGGNNLLQGLNGDDRLYGRDGDDVLIGGAGGDVLNGGAGMDTVSYSGSSAVFVSLALSGKNSGDSKGDIFVSIENLTGSNNDDALSGNGQDNIISGLSGDDTIRANAGNDTLNGGQGADLLEGGAGADKLSGGVGDDSLEGGAGPDELYGDSGRDTAVYAHSKGVTLALDGSKTASGDAIGDRWYGIENLVGSSTGRDWLGGDARANDIYGLGGNDALFGMGGNDYLVGGGGADALDGGSGKDVTSYFYGGRVSVALDGSIAATGDAAGDTFSSIENLVGSAAGDDLLVGDQSDNYIYGSGGNDTIDGRAGDDIIEGGAGADILAGGGGVDNFYYFDLGSGGDIIKDFSDNDVIVVNGTIFGNQHGFYAVDENFTTVSTGPVNSSTDVFTFRTSDHSLWYSAGGGASPVLLARLANGHVMTGYDIYIA